MSEVKKIIDRIEGERSKIRADLINLTKHFERLSEIMNTPEKRPSYLHCKKNMRILNAMIRGLTTLSFGMILRDEQEAEIRREEVEAQQRVKEAQEKREKRAAKKKKRAAIAKEADGSLEDQ